MDAAVEAIYGPIKPYRPRRSGYVYFVQQGADGPIKIGWSQNPKRRLASLQSNTPVPLRLIGIRWCAPTFERKLHERFVSARIKGEWYEPTPAILREAQKRRKVRNASAE